LNLTNKTQHWFSYF